MSEEGGQAKLATTAVEAGKFVLQNSAAAVRAVAEATTGRPQPPRPGENFVIGLLRNSSTALGGLAGLAIKAARDRMAAPEVQAAPAASTPHSATPRLHPGGTARIPLSIDNPGSEAMVGLRPRLIRATLDGAEAEPGFAVHFAPEALDIGPRDFEKLVVTITIAQDIAPGNWSLVFALRPDGSDPHELPFQIAAAGAAEA